MIEFTSENFIKFFEKLLLNANRIANESTRYNYGDSASIKDMIRSFKVTEDDLEEHVLKKHSLKKYKETGYFSTKDRDQMSLYSMTTKKFSTYLTKQISEYFSKKENLKDITKIFKEDMNIGDVIAYAITFKVKERVGVKYKVENHELIGPSRNIKYLTVIFNIGKTENGGFMRLINVLGYVKGSLDF